MAVTLVTMTSKAKEAKDGKAGKPEFKYAKIVTPATKRGGNDEAKEQNITPAFPTFAEFAQFMSGKVEIEIDKDGTPTGDSVLSLAIEGWNLKSNQNASFAAGNTIDSAVSKMNELIKDMAKKFGVTEDVVRTKLLG